MANDVVKTTFKFLNDKQATNSLLRDNARIDASLEDLDDAADKVTDAYTDMERAAEKAARANREAAETSVKAAKEQSELVGDVAARTGQLSGAISGLGAVGGQRLMIATDILDAAEAARLLQAEFPAMISQLGAMRGQLLLMGAAGAALAGVGAAISLYNKRKAEEKQRIEEARIAVEEWVAGLTEANRILLTGTDEDIEQTVKEAEDNLAILRATRVDIENELAGITEDFRTELIDELADVFTDVPRGDIQEVVDTLLGLGEFDFDPQQMQLSLFLLAELGDEVGDFQRETQNLKDQITDTDNQIVTITGDLEDFTTKVDEFKAALPEPSRILDALDDALFNIGSSGRLAINVFNDMADAVEPAQEMIDNYNKIVADQEAEALKAAAALFNLNEELEEVGTSFETLEAGAKLFAEAEAQRLAVVAETEQAILDVQTAGKDKRTALEQETQNKLTELEADRIEALGAIEGKHDERVNELKRKAQEEAIRDLQDFQRDQRRAEKDHRDTILDAAGRLDAVAILDEQRSFTKDQKRAKADFKLEQKRKKKEFKAELKAEDAAFKKELQQAKRNFRKRETELRDHLNRQIAAQRSAQTQEIAKLRGHQAQRLAEIDSALQAELTKLTGFTNEESAIRDDHYVQMLDHLNTFVDDANATLDGLGGGGAVGSPLIPNTPGAVGQFPLSAGLRSPSGIASPFASPMAMMPPVSRSMSTSTRSVQVDANFIMPDHITPGMARNLAKIVIQTLEAEIA